MSDREVCAAPSSSLEQAALFVTEAVAAEQYIHSLYEELVRQASHVEHLRRLAYQAAYEANAEASLAYNPSPYGVLPEFSDSAVVQEGDHATEVLSSFPTPVTSAGTGHYRTPSGWSYPG